MRHTWSAGAVPRLFYFAPSWGSAQPILECLGDKHRWTDDWEPGAANLMVVQTQVVSDHMQRKFWWFRFQ